MEPTITGTNLSKEQCEAAKTNCQSRKDRLHNPRECGDGEKVLKTFRRDELKKELERMGRS